MKDRYGYEMDRYGYEMDRYGYEKDRYGYEMDRYGYEKDRYGYEKDEPQTRVLEDLRLWLRCYSEQNYDHLWMSLGDMTARFLPRVKTMLVLPPTRLDMCG